MSDPDPSAGTASDWLHARVGEIRKLRILLRNFYAGVRVSPVIGAVCSAQVKNWAAHLERIADFWSHHRDGPTGHRGGLLARRPR